MAPVAKKQPAALERLLSKFTDVIDATTSDLAAGDIDVDAWRAEMERQLTRFHTAAYLAGAGRQMSLDELARKRIAGDVRVQLGYLDNFALELQDSTEFQTGWKARAESYADSIQIPYWAGRTKMLPLPAMPGEGSQCGSRCKCLWSIDTLDADAGNYDCRWIISSREPCQTCQERAAQWHPLEIRGGVLQ